jgi:sugar-specific transcriptional regulator TrmB
MRKSMYDDKVVKMLEKSGGMKASAVAKQLDTRASTIYKVLTRLVEQGRIIKDGQFFKAHQDFVTKMVSAASSIASLPVAEKKREMYESLERDAIKSTIKHEIEEVGKEIGQLTREMHVLRQIQDRLVSILERTK